MAECFSFSPCLKCLAPEMGFNFARSTETSKLVVNCKWTLTLKLHRFRLHSVWSWNKTVGDTFISSTYPSIQPHMQQKPPRTLCCWSVFSFFFFILPNQPTTWPKGASIIIIIITIVISKRSPRRWSALLRLDTSSVALTKNRSSKLQLQINANDTHTKIQDNDDPTRGTFRAELVSQFRFQGSTSTWEQRKSSNRILFPSSFSWFPSLRLQLDDWLTE